MAKYISPGAWFSIEYPTGWHEYEDNEETFLFCNPDRWSGNFRISAYQGKNQQYSRECIDIELKETRGARIVKVGAWECAYSSTSFQEKDEWYVTHFWLTGKGDISVECSFTVRRGDEIGVAEEMIATLHVRDKGGKPWQEIIPVRVLEISRINEAYAWVSDTVKKQLSKDFTGEEQDLPKLQKLIDGETIRPERQEAWEAIGIAFGTIIYNEMDGMEWKTEIDGPKGTLILQFEDTSVKVYPTKLVWNKIREGATCHLQAEFNRIKAEVEAVL